MIDNIKKILNELNGVDAWKIVERRTSSREVFFIKKEIDMNRGKEVSHYHVTVYKDFEENGKNYRGSSSTNIHPTMSEDEIKSALEEAVYAAGFVKNEYYPLVSFGISNLVEIESNFGNDTPSNWLPKITDAIYKEDIYSEGSINSAELFLNKNYTRILNSDGLDVSYNGYTGMIEAIANWNGEKEEVEVYKNIEFTEFDEEMINEEIKNMLLLCKEKSIAKPTPNLKNIRVLLTGEPVGEFFKYYYFKSNAKQIYDGLSTLKIGDKVQGEEVKGDLISMTLDPKLKNSTSSFPYDADGFHLSRTQVIEDGLLLKYWGDLRHSYYLGVEPTGNIGNFLIEGGSESIEDMKSEPYLELVSFSDFQMDELTGDFGGEIRLGWYFDGKDTVPVTGGSVSGNIKDVEKEIYLSEEMQKVNNFVGPKTIQLTNVSIAGIK